MIASVFSKTRPINYILLGLGLLVFYLLYIFKESSWLNDSWLVVRNIVLFLVLCSSFFIVNFITLKNNLTKLNNYAILIFAVFLLLFPTIFKNSNVIMANFFVLLAFRKLISVQTLKNSKEKLFDASLWIFVATIFHFWCILFIGLVFLYIIFHISNDYRNWIVPILALFTVLIMTYLIDFIFLNGLMNTVIENIKISFKFSYFENIYQNIALALFSSVAIMFFFTQVIDLPNKPLNMQATYKKLIFAFILGALVYIFSNHKNNSFLIYCLAPLSILGANFVERIKTNWMKELTLYLMVGISIFLFLMQL